METDARQRVQLVIHGAVQGVGFRPFVHRLASEMHLNGFVLNDLEGVIVEAESDKTSLDRFISRIEKEKPPMAIIQSLEFSYLSPVPYHGFEIKPSRANGRRVALILPDIAVCPDCLREMRDPDNRRFQYPFINCTHCGPRFSIMESLPYDRPNTSMKIFEMCPACLDEYHDPSNRRFHAQPTACPACGPSVLLFMGRSKRQFTGDTAIQRAADVLRDGKILALKGLGGFQLLCDASRQDVVNELRRRKKRDAKPFAVMFPNLPDLQKTCHIDPMEERLLTSPESPIVLLRRREYGRSFSPFETAAPGHPYLGVLLPYTPLHHLLMEICGMPVICTSGNHSEEPMCTDNEEAIRRLSDIADAFLMHDRPIVRAVDDSIVRVVLGREMMLRRARGYTPLPLAIRSVEKPYLAVGAHLKSTITVAHHGMAFTGQHLGDLSTEESFRAFARSAADLPRLYDIHEPTVLCDAHPDYRSTQFAHALAPRPQKVQHHAAHVAACYAENQLSGKVLGVSWDGTGFGDDGTVWGGEFFVFEENTCRRFAHLRTFPLPGGEIAVSEPRRSALGVLYELFGNGLQYHDHPHFTVPEFNLQMTMLRKNLRCVTTSSMGRLFDAVASITRLCQKNSFEGEAAMMLEFSCDPSESDAYAFSFHRSTPIVVDWEPVVRGVWNDLLSKKPVRLIASKFHNALADLIRNVAEAAGLKRVVLSGGCFQNITLLHKTVDVLNAANLQPFWHQRIPTNDGGISFGQIAFAALNDQQGEPHVSGCAG